MSDFDPSNVVVMFGEILTCEQLIRSRLSRALPKGMELSHFMLLNHLVNSKSERRPSQLAKSFNVTRGAMTNTLKKLELSGYVHIRPDWDDARRKLVAISPAGRQARDTALSEVEPLVSTIMSDLGDDRMRQALPILRGLRETLSIR